MDRPRVLIIADNASSKFGGEALHPLRYFRIMHRKGVDVRMITHERNKDHLAGLMSADEMGRITFVPDSRFHTLCYRVSRYLPPRIANFTIELASRMVTQLQSKRIARRLIAEGHVDVVHQPIPISPKELSFLYGLGVPVVMGPLDGNMQFPPAFRRRERKTALLFTGVSRRLSHLLNRLIPGKLNADVLLVSNQRTRDGLPRGVRGRVIDLVENGVELDIWQPKSRYTGPGDPVRFMYLGRLVDWKAVDVLIKAFAQAAPRVNGTLEIVGDGELRKDLEKLAADLGVADRVHFAGWVAQREASRRLADSDVFILPSIYECGGAVVMEAMAVGIPVIATRWGGPADYVDESCGILVDPASEQDLVRGIADAMVKLAESPQLREQMGRAGRARALQLFSWDGKIDTLLDIFDDAVAARRG